MPRPAQPQRFTPSKPAPACVVSKHSLSHWAEIVNAARSVSRAAAALILRWQSGELEVLAASVDGDGPYEVGKRFPVGEGRYFESVITRNTKVSVSDGSLEAAWSSSPDVKAGLVSFLGLPIVLSSGEVFGAICLLASHPSQFAEGCEDLLLHLKKEIERDLEPDGEESAAQAEEKARLIQFAVDRAGEGIFWVDLDAKIFDANKQACRYLGYSRDELVGQHVFDFDPEFSRERWPQFLSQLREQGCLTFESTHRTKAGKIVPVEITSNFLTFDGREFLCAFVRDISDRKKTEAALQEARGALEERVVERTASLRDANQRLQREIHEREEAQRCLAASEQRYRSLVENMPEVAWTADCRGATVFMSSKIMDVLGYEPREIIAGGSEFWLEHIHPDDKERVGEAFYALFAGSDGFDEEYRMRNRDGSYRWVHDRAVRAYDRDGVACADGILADVTERKKAGAALQESEAKFRALVETATASILIFRGSVLLYANPAAEGMTGYSLAELYAMDVRDMVHPDSRGGLDERERAIERGEEVNKRYEIRIVRKDGVVRWHEFSAAPIEYQAEHATLIVVYDVTDRKLAEEALRYKSRLEGLITSISTKFIDLASDQIDDGISDALRILGEFAEVDRCYVFLISTDGKRNSNTHEWCAEGVASMTHRLQDLRLADFPWVNKRFERLETVYVPRVADLPEEADEERKEWEAEGIQSLVCVPMVFRGSLMGVVGFDSVRSEHDWPQEIIALLRLVGEIFAIAIARKRADEAFTETQRTLGTLLSNLPGVVYRCKNDPKWTVEFFSKSCLELTGYPPEEFTENGKSYADVIHPDDRQRVWDEVQTALHEDRSFQLDYRIQTATGETKFVTEQGVGVSDREGNIQALEGFVTDVTARVKADEDKEQLEIRLRQAQKMEAMGTLASGVAHDLNNMIAVMLGNTELLKRRIGDNPAAAEALGLMEKAIEQARNLTQSLLTFSRKQRVESTVVDLRAVVRDSADLIRSILPSTIKLEVEGSDEEPVCVLADESQLHQVVFNLAINARDAMPYGGVLRLRAQPPETVSSQTNGAVDRARSMARLIVTDTGSGMVPKVQSRIFEPFFTTKSRGQGTGLGLAIIHGIVKNHGGRLEVHSQPGKGSTFEVLLPAAPANHDVVGEQPEPAVRRHPKKARNAPAKGRSTRSRRANP